MTFLAWFFRGVPAVLLCLSMNGCLPGGQSPADEEKEPHYLAGRSAFNGMDYPGAIEEFEKALELNPHSALAHYQLGMLYEEKEPDPAIAIYHYEQFLKLRPHADNAEVIKQRILNCKQDLAKTVSLLPAASGVQRELEQLVEKNKQLQERLNQWETYYKSQTQTANVVPTPPVVRTTVLSNQTVQSSSSRPVSSDNRSPVRLMANRTHVVQAGETPAAIARKYGIRLDALMSANPGLDPRKLRVGQTVNVPGS